MAYVVPSDPSGQRPMYMMHIYQQGGKGTKHQWDEMTMNVDPTDHHLVASGHNRYIWHWNIDSMYFSFGCAHEASINGDGCIQMID
jgi:hypothetical protein